jgi:hypothetical protein
LAPRFPLMRIQPLCHFIKSHSITQLTPATAPKGWGLELCFDKFVDINHAESQQRTKPDARNAGLAPCRVVANKLSGYVQQLRDLIHVEQWFGFSRHGCVFDEGRHGCLTMTRPGRDSLFTKVARLAGLRAFSLHLAVPGDQRSPLCGHPGARLLAGFVPW